LSIALLHSWIIIHAVKAAAQEANRGSKKPIGCECFQDAISSLYSFQEMSQLLGHTMHAWAPVRVQEACKLGAKKMQFVFQCGRISIRFRPISFKWGANDL
jgi:hypothetical protein